MSTRKTPPTPLRVAIYVRVSSEEQARHGDSLRDQLESGREYIHSHNNMILQDIYTDDGISGQKLDREEFTRLMKNVEAGLIDLIVFTKIDRWFRSLRHYLNTQEILESHQVNWLAINQPYFDTSTPHGRAFIAQSMMWAELEAQNDSVRIQDVFASKARYGEVLSGKHPRGYSIVDKHLIPNKDAPAIYDIFQFYRDKGSLRQTLQYMEQEYDWNMTQANLRQSILKNKKYIGVFRDNKNYCPPLVPADLFEEVQVLLSKNVKSSQKYTYLFSGLLTCADCGYKLCSCHINVSACGGKYKYQYPAYICGQYRRCKACQNSSAIREARIEEYLLFHICGELRHCAALYEIENKPEKNMQAKRNTLLKKIDKLKELYLNDCISLEEYKCDKTYLQSRMGQLGESAEQPQKDLSKVNNLLKHNFESLYSDMTNAEKRQFWRAVIKEIQIGKGQNRRREYTIIFL